MSKKLIKIISGIVLALIVLTFSYLVYYLFFDPKYDPKNWNPFFSFYRSSSCFTNSKTKYLSNVCYIGGIRSQESRGTFKSLFSLLDLKKSDNTPVKIEEIKCQRESFNVGQENETAEDVALPGVIYHCWFINPLPEKINLTSSYWNTE